MNDDEKRGSARQGSLITGAISVAFIWAFFVACWGLIKWERNGTPDFTMTGQFGDSFGFIGALMAGTAAYFAYRTYQAQSEETRLLRQERAEAARVRAEPSFLSLLERRYATLDQVTYMETMRSADAIRDLASAIGGVYPQTNGSLVTAYHDRMRYTSGTENYFRFIYHIIRYAERQFEKPMPDVERNITRSSLSYHYVRLLRSQLSDAELFILALNVLTPPGDGAKKLYERYALFHNLSERRKVLVRAAGEWDERAFGLPPEDTSDH